MSDKPTNFVVFILTHKRAGRVKTIETLRKSGYTGRIVLVLDNEDNQIEDYRKYYSEEIVVFDKKEMAQKTDNGDNFNDRRTITHARNASFEIAKKLGVKYFLQLDDDYTHFYYKYNHNYEYGNFHILNLDKVFFELLEFYKNTSALSIAMAQNGDFIGGKKGGMAQDKKPKRKAMNSFFCSTDRPFKFVGTMNEDVNTYISLGSRGNIFMTVANVALKQIQTQQNAGGITDLYKDMGTYRKAFYTVMFAPSCVTISEMGNKDRRLHHRINWNNAVPKIIPERLRKVKDK